VTVKATSSTVASPADANTPPERGAGPTFHPKEVVRPRLQIEEQIRSAILSGELTGGDRLPSEAELARMFNVSRNTVREALRSLETQSLIRKIPGAGGGSFVQSVDHKSFRNVLQDSMRNLVQLGSIRYDELAAMRQFLEVPSVRLAATNGTDEDVADLRRIVELQRVASLDDPSIPDLDMEFHSKIAQASGNRLLLTFVQALHRETEPVLYLDLSPEVGRTAWRQHNELVRAIAAHDADEAERTVIEHLEYLRTHISKSLDETRHTSARIAAATTPAE
jgi:GntR family transcriptional regulator, transcriptional repressor for pyruvate dehydrogenase complex